MKSQMLTLIAERPIAALLSAGDDQRRLEASGVTVRGDHVYVAFDNMGRVSRLKADLSVNSEGEVWYGEVDPKEGYEAICWHAPESCFYTVIEAVKMGGKKRFQAIVRRFDADLNLLDADPVDHVFKRENKGLEGLAVVGTGAQKRLLGLCEAPGGKGKKKRGEVLLLRSGPPWSVERTLKLPENARFDDFSDLAVDGSGRVAVVSQEDSAMWVGHLDTASWTFDEGRVYHFPYDAKGKVVYGNVEGVAWLPSGNTAQRVVVVSDRAKDDQPGRVRSKEQSIHIFEIPAG